MHMTPLSSSSLRKAADDQIARVLSLLSDQICGPRGCLLTFHRAAPRATWDALPNRDFWLNLDFLELLLAHLQQTGWEIVTIGEMIARGRDNLSTARLVNFSVDDCYADTYHAVVPLFRKYASPVTLFVTTGIPDALHLMPWAGLELILARRDNVLTETGPLDVSTPAAKRRAYVELWTQWEQGDLTQSYLSFSARNGFDSEEVRSSHAITWDMLEVLRDDPLVEIGAHTVTHPRISGLPASAAMAEIRGSKARLEERLGIDVAHFAFPFGRRGDCGPRDFELVREAGFASASTTTKGLLKMGQSPFCLPRNTINGGRQSLALMHAMLTGAAGVAARVLGRV